jgi:hypothetical protein
MPPQQTQQTAEPVVPPANNEPMFERKEFVSVPPVEQMAPVSTIATTEVPVTATVAPIDAGSGDEGFEHGRKVFVKRRPLKEDGSEESESSGTVKDVPGNDAPESTQTEIQFGRRKGR